MPARPRQMILPLEHEPQYGEDDFLVAPSNEAAWRLVLGWPDWPDCGVLLCGPDGSGKSHIGTIWAERAGAVRLYGNELSALDPSTLAPGTPLLVEDADGADASETALFHLLNAVREHGLWLLATSRRPPGDEWPALRDLASRLRALPRAHLDVPDDELVRAVLVKLFMDRQLTVEADVVDYVARRIERSLSAARRIVTEIDAEGLALGRRVTKPVAAAVIARLEAPED